MERYSIQCPFLGVSSLRGSTVYIRVYFKSSSKSSTGINTGFFSNGGRDTLMQFVHAMMCAAQLTLLGRVSKEKNQRLKF